MNPQSNGVIITNNEEQIRKYLKAYQPGLKLLRPGHIEGVIRFAMHLTEPGYEILDPKGSYVGLPTLIEDHYAISIEYNQQGQDYPKVKETGARIKSSLEIISRRVPKIKTLQDLHMYEDESLCLCTYTHYEAKYPNGLSISELCDDLVIPYFYYQSYLLIYFKEPWETYSHGSLGLFEYLVDNRNQKAILERTASLIPDKVREFIKRKKPSSKRDCLCGSGVSGMKCHHKAIIGAKIVYKYFH